MLSSVELCIVDQADIIQMQNWEHVISTFDLMNLEIKSNPGQTEIDFTKIRDFNLYGKSQYFRQTMIFSSFMTPDINSLFNGDYCKNVLGKVKVRNIYQSMIPQGVPQVRNSQNLKERFFKD
jgi:U3 small nucleolar RNA-associated protein 25